MTNADEKREEIEKQMIDYGQEIRRVMQGFSPRPKLVEAVLSCVSTGAYFLVEARELYTEKKLIPIAKMGLESYVRALSFQSSYAEEINTLLLDYVNTEKAKKWCLLSEDVIEKEVEKHVKSFENNLRLKLGMAGILKGE